VRSVLIDTNILIGALDPADRLHARALEGLRQATGELVTTWPVVTEAVHCLGRRGWRHQEALLKMIAEKALTLAPLTAEDAPRLKDLMEKYRDRPMDLADASLLRVAQRDGIETVVTLDRDFRVYRAAGIGALKMLPRP